MTGTISSAPLAALASAPVKGGVCRSGMTDAGGPESSGRAQHGADILRVGDLIEHKQNAFGRAHLRARPGQGLGLEHHALMHGVGSEQPVELLGSASSALTPRAFSAGSRRRAAFSVASSLPDGPVRVGECCLHGMDAIEQDAVGIGRPPRISGLSGAGRKSALRLVFGARQGGETCKGLRSKVLDDANSPGMKHFSGSLKGFAVDSGQSAYHKPPIGGPCRPTAGRFGLDRIHQSTIHLLKEGCPSG